MPGLRRTVGALLALVCGGAGGGLALAHPVSPLLALAGFYTVLVVACWRPAAWLWLVPACLPFLNFSPWTGWLIFDEFDLLLLAVLAAGYGRLAWQAGPGQWLHFSASPWLLALAGATLLSLLRGVLDAAGGAAAWSGFQGYGDPLNSLRVLKSLLWAWLCLPLLHHALRLGAAPVCRRVAAGMLAGLVVVTLAVLWERGAFPGWFNFSSKYRTTALFWEMHVGGAAIDAYLALATPFAVWALRTARRPWQWGCGALLALALAYAGLTTFSRGVYLSMVAPLLLLGLLLWLQKAGLDLRALGRDLWRRRRPVGWRAKSAWVLGLALLAEVWGVLHGGSFMADRLAATERDFGSRMAHWQRGLGLLQTPLDWTVGIGLGRLPSQYAARYPEGAWPGHVAWKAPQPGQPASVVLSGPDVVVAAETGDAAAAEEEGNDLNGLFSLAQRVQPVPGERYRADLAVRVGAPAAVYVQLCERHVLYPGRCQSAFTALQPTPPGVSPWQRIGLPLNGPQFKGGPWYAQRNGLFTVTIVGTGAVAEFQSIGLHGRNGHALLANGDFARNLAHWWPVARSYFLPWHIDNLYLELLVERGLLGLLLAGALVATALWHLVLGRVRHQPLAPYLAASLVGGLLVGLVSSVMDVPRVAFLLLWLALLAWAWAQAAEPPARPAIGLLYK